MVIDRLLEKIIWTLTLLYINRKFNRLTKLIIKNKGRGLMKVTYKAGKISMGVTVTEVKNGEVTTPLKAHVEAENTESEVTLNTEELKEVHNCFLENTKDMRENIAKPLITMLDKYIQKGFDLGAKAMEDQKAERTADREQSIKEYELRVKEYEAGIRK